MQTRKKDFSILGFGCMRFPKRGGRIDPYATEHLIVHAIEYGINYFDTAYIYNGSEAVLGDILKKNHLRERIHIATKMPHYLIKNMEDFESLFRTQLQRLQTDYIDNYLMHMLPDIDIWHKLEEKGIRKWIADKKEAGQIRNIGFSFHGNSEAFCELLDAYPWDFCQCQYNYMDENSQAGRKGVQHAAELGIPVVIMEPLRGGRLINGLPAEAKSLFENTLPGWKKSGRATPAEWGLSWLYNQPEVAVVLSGMNSMEMLDENIRIADESHAGMYTQQDFEVIAKARKILDAKIKVPCTGCGYCMPCPHGVDIPGCFRAYNNQAIDGHFASVKEYLMTTALRAQKSYASMCVRCGRCEALCPQSIPIRDKLEETAQHMEGAIFRGAEFFSRPMFRK